MLTVGDFVVGEEVEVVLNPATGYPAISNSTPDSSWPWARTKVIYLGTTIRGLDVLWNGKGWGISERCLSTHIRKIPKAPSIPTAGACIHCGDGFAFPVEYNVVGGRLCWSCKQTQAWAYQALT